MCLSFGGTELMYTCKCPWENNIQGLKVAIKMAVDKFAQALGRTRTFKVERFHGA